MSGDKVRDWYAVNGLDSEIGERRYIAAKTLAPWQVDATCDVCRRYLVCGAGTQGQANVEGSLFCLFCPDCDPGQCEQTEATPERVMAWRVWAIAKRERDAAIERKEQRIRWRRQRHDDLMRRSVTAGGYTR